MRGISSKISGNGFVERRRYLREFMLPGDFVFFGENGEGDIFYVKTIGDKKVYATGDYFSRSSGKIESKRISLEKISDSDPRISRPRRILS